MKKATRALSLNNFRKIANSKRSISPVIATVLLIAIVVVLALIIFLWAKGFVKESIQKQGMSAEQACSEVKLEVNYIGNKLEISNKGNVPVYRFDIKGKSSGIVEKVDLGENENEGLDAGQSTSFDVGDYDKVEVFPVILGKVRTSKKAYTCKNSFAAERT